MASNASGVRDRYAVSVLRAADILDDRVFDLLFEAFRRVPRECFYPAYCQSRIFENVALPFAADQLDWQPSRLARMLSLIAPEKRRRVLMVGAGSGYAAALLAEIGVQVYVLENQPAIAQHARKLLDRLSYQTVLIRVADAQKGWADHAPFDSVLFHSLIDRLPSRLFEQVCDGGALVGVVGSAGQGELTYWQREPALGGDRKPEAVRYALETIHLAGDEEEILDSRSRRQPVIGELSPDFST